MVSEAKFKEILLNGPKTPLEKKAYDDYEHYLITTKKQDPYTPQGMKDNITYFIECAIANKLFKTQEAETLATELLNKINKIIPMNVLRNQKKQQEGRRLIRQKNNQQARAGFTNSIIVLYVVLNLGLFLACLLLLV